MKIKEGLEMRYRPFDNYISMQNPPDFSWPYEAGVTGYDLIVCRDAGLRDVAYRLDHFHANYYNFPYTFEPGIYYWAVRSRREGAAGSWSSPRRFLLHALSEPFPVPDVDTLLSRIPEGHPRIYATAAGLEEFRRGIKEEGRDSLPMVRRALAGFMSMPFPEEKDADPRISTPYNMFSPFQTAADLTKLACNMAMYAGFAYLADQEEKAGRFGVECLMKLAKWDPEGGTSYEVNDQAHRRIAVYSTLAYDWLYPLLTPGQRSEVLEMIRKRVEVIWHSDVYHIKNLDKSPFDSHGGTAVGYVLLMGLALYRDVPQAEEWLRYTLPLYINYMYPWSNEDGGWAQGTYYWTCNIFGKKVIEALLCSGVIDLYRKAWQKREHLFAIYCCPEGSVGAFGDNSYIPATAKMSSLLSVLAHRIATPEARWARSRIGYLTAYGHTDDSDPSVCIHDRVYSPEEAYIPENMPKDHYFKDIGWIAMHSDLEDAERISVFFKSSWYGSFNHSHPDQNSFIIQAFGKPLAIDSGYYDLYNYPFDRDYTRKTYAHNAVTYDNGQGQPAMDILAKGKITDFLSHPAAALAGGDATESYRGGLGCARRWLLYLRPDVVITIDELAAKENKQSRFEYWLNAQKWAFLGEDRASARFITDHAQLDMRMLFPRRPDAFISHDFAGPDGMPLYPVYEGHARWPVQKRVWFRTESCSSIYMVSVLDIHRTGTPPRNWHVEYREDCIVLELEDGALLAVNHKGSGEEIAVGDFAFRGTAALVGDKCRMLVNGRELSVRGKRVFACGSPISAAAGEGRLEISAIHRDADVTVYLPGVKQVVTGEGKAVGVDSAAFGVTLKQNDDKSVFSLYNGHYDFRYT